MTDTDATPGPDGHETASAEPALHAGPTTLSFDIGGTGLKAAVLDASGALIGERVRTPTTYPLPPDVMVRDLVALAESCRRSTASRPASPATSAPAGSCPRRTT